jgi:hypothetical protein
MPICKICGKDSFWTVDLNSKLCKDCKTKKNIESQKIAEEKKKNIESQKIAEEKKNPSYVPPAQNVPPAKKQIGNDLSKKEARNKLKLAKENLDLELITQEEYDILKKKLKPIIMDEDFVIKEDTITNEETIENTKIEQEPMPLLPPSFSTALGEPKNYLSPLGQWRWSGSEWVNVADLKQKNTAIKSDENESYEEFKIRRKVEKNKKNSKWVWIGGILFILWLIGTLMPPNLKCENCGIVMKPNQTAYTTSAITSTAGELSKAGYHDKLCSTRCLGEFAKKYPSIKNTW